MLFFGITPGSSLRWTADVPDAPLGARRSRIGSAGSPRVDAAATSSAGCSYGSQSTAPPAARRWTGGVTTGVLSADRTDVVGARRDVRVTRPGAGRVLSLQVGPPR